MLYGEACERPPGKISPGSVSNAGHSIGSGGRTTGESLQFGACTSATPKNSFPIALRGPLQVGIPKGTYKGKDSSGRYPWTDAWVKRGGQC